MSMYYDDEEAWALVEAGLDAMATPPFIERDGEAGWVREPGQYVYAKDTDIAGYWVTVEEAAELCNVAVREIEDRYRPQMLAFYPGSVIEPLTECEYVYDFEADGFSWEGYAPKETDKVDVYGPSFRCAPELTLGYVPDPDEGSDALILKGYNPDGFDAGLEPKHRTTVKEVQPRLYERSALMEIRARRVLSRKEKPIPPRGKGGRFTKAVA